MTSVFLKSVISCFRIPKSQTHLGRWSLKHDPRLCENYLQNLYAEPGYPNSLKSKWLENQKKKKGKTNVS